MKIRILALLALAHVFPGCANAQPSQLPQENWIEIGSVMVPTGSGHLLQSASGRILVFVRSNPSNLLFEFTRDLQPMGGPKPLPNAVEIDPGLELPGGTFLALQGGGVVELDANLAVLRTILPNASGPGSVGSVQSISRSTATGKIFVLCGGLTRKVVVLSPSLVFESEWHRPGLPPIGIEGFNLITADSQADEVWLTTRFSASGMTASRYSASGALIARTTFSTATEAGNPGGNGIGITQADEVIYGAVDRNSSFGALLPSAFVQFLAWNRNGSVIGYGTANRSPSFGNSSIRVYGDDLYAISAPNPNVGDFVVRMRRTYRAPANAVSPHIPRPAIVSQRARPGTSIVDIDYTVTDPDSPVAQTAAIGLTEGVRSLAGAVRLSTLIDGTSANIGTGIATGTQRRISWDAGADIGGTGFRNLELRLLASDGRGLIDLHFVRLPPDVPSMGDPELFLATGPLQEADLLSAWFWLVASSDNGIAFNSAAGRVTGVAGSGFDGQLLAQGTSTTSAGRQYLWNKLSVCEATTAEVTRGRAGTTPGVQQYVPEKRTGVLPNRVNEVGIDTGTLTGHWVRMKTGPSCA